MTNASFRERMNLNDNQHNVSGSIISQTIEDDLIKVFDPENKANRYTKYVPYWHS
jgi:hypothetical protein